MGVGGESQLVWDCPLTQLVKREGTAEAELKPGLSVYLPSDLISSPLGQTVGGGGGGGEVR